MKALSATATPKRTNWTRLLVFSALLALASACGGALDDGNLDRTVDEASLTEKSGAGDLVVTISMVKTYYGENESPLVDVTITNVARNTVKFLSWALPTAEIEENLFAVKLGAARVVYTGAVYKRKAPQASDFITLASGQSMTGTVDLALVYDLSVSGQYTVQFDLVASKLKGQATKDAPSIQSNTLSVAIDGRGGKPPVDTGPYVKCNATQQGTLTSAKSTADLMSGAALTSLAGNPGASYTTWFGVYDADRYATAGQHFNAIHGAFDLQGSIAATIAFDCSCKKRNVYAYVYPTKPYLIYLCGAFWAAGPRGTDSQPGTLIHEMSHFQVVASTTDYGYGQAFCKDLALTDPAKAIFNADNHEYFAETLYGP